MIPLIVIVGPTASGKSGLAVALAKKFRGEIVSADSRQVYRGMNIGTGKVTKKEMRSVRHFLLDVASPKRQFTVVQYRAQALKAIRDIAKRGRVPFLVGGTGFYIQSVIDDFIIPNVPPDKKLRVKLGKKSLTELLAMLGARDPARLKTIDAKNKRRVVRALEIVLKSGQLVPRLTVTSSKEFSVLAIGIKKDSAKLKEKIHQRLTARLRRGMITEVKNLHEKNGVSWKRLEELGLEYRWISRYLQQKVSRAKMVEKLQKEIEHYAKRQMTWFGRDKRIHWIERPQVAHILARQFLKSLRQ